MNTNMSTIEKARKNPRLFFRVHLSYVQLLKDTDL